MKSRAAIFIVSFIMFNFCWSAEEVSTFKQDIPLLKKITAKLLKSVRYNLHFIEDETSHVILDSKNIFQISISKKDYDESGTIEGALALTCHELGHAAKGTSHNGKKRDGYVSSEEDADYWAGQICMPEMLNHFSQASLKKTSFDEEFKKSCDHLSNLKEQELCYRGVRGAYFFRDNKDFKGICNSQDISFKFNQNLAKTPYKGARGPNPLQCSFNNMAAGVLKQSQPACENLVLGYFAIYNEKCDVNIDYKNRFGVEEDESLSTDNSSRTLVKEKIPADTPVVKQSETFSK